MGFEVAGAGGCARPSPVTLLFSRPPLFGGLLSRGLCFGVGPPHHHAIFNLESYRFESLPGARPGDATPGVYRKPRIMHSALNKATIGAQKPMRLPFQRRAGVRATVEIAEHLAAAMIIAIAPARDKNIPPRAGVFGAKAARRTRRQFI